MKFISHFEAEKKLTNKTTQMATVTVRTLDEKMIGTYSWSRKPDEKQIQEMIDILIREHILYKHFNTNELSNYD